MTLITRSLATSLAALGGVALLCSPRPAQAEGVAVSPGFNFNVAFGQKVTFGLGLDVHVTGILVGRISSCSSTSRLGLGGFAQATWLINARAGRFAAGLQGGGEVYEQNIAADGELGWTYRTRLDEHPGQHGLHVGALGLFAPKRGPGPITPWLELPLRVAIPLSGGLVRAPEIIPGLGVRVPAMFGIPSGGCIEGRPLRTDEGITLPGVMALGERRARHPRLDQGTRAALADAWLEDARAECGSVPTFLALARDLSAAGAPAALVDRALAAAGDEIRHTFSCRELASDLAGLDLQPLPFGPPPPRPEDRRDALLRLALEAWFDGCLGEGAAADRAERARAASDEPGAGAALDAIARDERAHAELGWAVLGHCLAAGGSEVGDMLAQALDAPAAEPPRGDPERDADRAALRAHGRLAQPDVDAAWRATEARARRRAAALLA